MIVWERRGMSRKKIQYIKKYTCDSAEAYQGITSLFKITVNKYSVERERYEIAGSLIFSADEAKDFTTDIESIRIAKG